MTLFTLLLCSAVRSSRSNLRSEPPREGVCRGLHPRPPASSTAQVSCTLLGPLPGRLSQTMSSGGNMSKVS